jgi:nitrate reductase NapE component
MNPAEKAAVSVEAARQHQHKQAQATSQQKLSKSRADLYVFLGVLVLAILSVVALGLTGGK